VRSSWRSLWNGIQAPTWESCGMNIMTNISFWRVSDLLCSFVLLASRGCKISQIHVRVWNVGERLVGSNWKLWNWKLWHSNAHQARMRTRACGIHHIYVTCSQAFICGLLNHEFRHRSEAASKIEHLTPNLDVCVQSPVLCASVGCFPFPWKFYPGHMPDALPVASCIRTENLYSFLFSTLPLSYR